MNQFIRTYRHGAVYVLVLWGLLGTLTGCATPRSTAPTRNPPFSQDRGYDERAARKEVEGVRRMIESGEFSPAIPRLLHTIGKYPRSEASYDARFWLGVAYYNLHSYRDAIDSFKEYLQLNPEGRHAEECRDYAARLKQDYQDRFPTPEGLDAEVERLAQALKADPANVDLQLQLADALWRRGSYEDAGRLYAVVLDRQPELGTREDIARRIERLADGEYLLLTPSEVQRREVAERPLSIVNTHSFGSGPDLYTRTSRYYVVTGQAWNRSESMLYGVQVFVTIYGFGNVVYDTTTVNVGSLRPQERRAFSVRFSNFENIENIERYEAEGTFQR